MGIEKNLADWPEGTKEIRKGNKREIIFPRPVNMNAFSREELKNNHKNKHCSEILKNPEFSGDKKAVGPERAEVKHNAIRRYSMKKLKQKYPARQEKISKERGEERAFSDKKKWELL